MAAEVHRCSRPQVKFTNLRSEPDQRNRKFRAPSKEITVPKTCSLFSFLCLEGGATRDLWYSSPARYGLWWSLPWRSCPRHSTQRRLLSFTKKVESWDRFSPQNQTLCPPGRSSFQTAPNCLSPFPDPGGCVPLEISKQCLNVRVTGEVITQMEL